MKHIICSATLAFVVVWPALRPVDAAAQTPPVLDNKMIEIEYVEPNKSYLRVIHERYKQRQILENLKQFLSPLQLPVKLRITALQCDQTNSWWAGRKQGLWLCYEWADYGERLAPMETTPDGMTREDAVLGAFLQVVFHELGHAMFDIFDIPVFGREEDAADQMAGFILWQFGKDVARRTLPATAYLWQKDAESWDSLGGWRRDTFSDEHGHPLQRAYNFLCMAYGGGPETFQYFVDKGLLPKERAVNCAREFQQIRNAFVKTMLPHVDPAMMEVVKSKEWLLPPGSEAVPR
jgi:hypothetical protein